MRSRRGRCPHPAAWRRPRPAPGRRSAPSAARPARPALGVREGPRPAAAAVGAAGGRRRAAGAGSGAGAGEPQRPARRRGADERRELRRRLPRSSLVLVVGWPGSSGSPEARRRFPAPRSPAGPCPARPGQRSGPRAAGRISTPGGSAGSGAARAGQRLQRARLACAAPLGQVRRVQPLAAQQRADLARPCRRRPRAGWQLVLGAEAPALGPLGQLGIGWAGHGLRIDPGPGCRHRQGHELGVLPLALVSE